MLGTYACLLLIGGASSVIGQAVFALGGRRSWSGLAPAVGLAVLISLAWATVRLPGEGVTALIALGALTAIAGVVVWRRRPGFERGEVRLKIAVAIGAIVLASLPFLVEWRFGILGTGLNPDMSQHLFATDRLASGDTERLISEGYPLGPHALVVALSQPGPGLVQAFNGLMIATAVATCLAALAAIARPPTSLAVAAALTAGFAYLLASNYIQGAFKEALAALFLLAFAIGLAELAGGGPERRPVRRALRALPLVALAAGAVYAYSFPGLLWLGGALGVWTAIELGRGLRRGGAAEALRLVRLAAPTALAGFAMLAIAIAPELGRIVEFASFETFDPEGPGLGNLFNRISPLEALGIWPSGDFRLEPGDGGVPAALFYLGAGFGAAALGYGLLRWLRAGERAVPAALLGAAMLWLYALTAGTPYQEAKALVVLAPLVALISVRALAREAPRAIAVAFIIAAGGSAVLALVNGPVGPSAYSPALAELRSKLGPRSTIVFGPPELLSEQQGRDYLNWELRDNRICIEPFEDGVTKPPRGASVLRVLLDDQGAVVPDGASLVRGAPLADEPCALIGDRARADPGTAGE